ncbi:MAG TPA: UDP-N-acetylmuramoyl-L-alanine--D-glutamate ligase [Erysipelothrix sp.]|nr:UDP-N-acetylmuramoyl-L-alanine--D-glutamate ligase [Erysipelothrix sp.]
MQLNLVLGAGKSGLSIAKLLLEKGEAVLIADDKLSKLPEEFNQYPLCILYSRGLKLDLAEIEYKRVIKSPGLPHTHPLVDKLSQKYFMYSDIEIAYEYAQDLTFVAITGSNGKTTVTKFLEHIGSPMIVSAGNIGIPLSEVVLNYENKIVALELSSFQLEGIKTFKPKVATILNLSPDHLDRYYDVNGYYNTKLNVYKNMSKEDTFILNTDDIQLNKRIKNLNASVIEASLAYDKEIHIDKGIVYFNEVELFKIRDLKVVGTHNIFNAMIAASMAYVLGIPVSQIQKRVSSFKGVEHRLEFVLEKEGVSYFNDSKATNPEATEVALRAFSHNNIHLILGGYDKQISFDVLKSYQDKCKSIHAFGQTKAKIKKLFNEAIVSETLDEVIQKLSPAKGDVVLFSPACASYDQFDNYEQRGHRFKELIT